MYKDIFDCVVSVKPESLEVGINEVFIADAKAKVTKWLDKGIALIRLSKGFDYLSENFRQKPPIFIQHIFPVAFTLDIVADNSDDNVKDIETILEASKESLLLLNAEKTFSVQARVFADMEKSYVRQDFEEIFSNYLKSKGIILNVQEPEQAVSIAVADNTFYIGVSDIRDNLSSWAGGIHRFSREKEQVSRAEFKLLEAIDYYNLEVTNLKTAMDLGAAPGGWSRVLLNMGLEVYAIDPANLDDSLVNEKNLKHFKETAQEFFNRAINFEFDIIVNDMKMDTKESAKLMVEAYESLKKNGLGIITLKLPKNDIKKKVKDALKILEKCYKIIGVRQLYHNRSEVTVVLQK